jgi:hypothetical protein
LSHGVQRIAENEPHPLHRSEQIANDRKSAAFDAGEQERGAFRAKGAALDFRQFEIRIDLGVDSPQVTVPFEVVDAFMQIAMAHAVQFRLRRSDFKRQERKCRRIAAARMTWRKKTGAPVCFRAGDPCSVEDAVLVVEDGPAIKTGRMPPL